MKPLIVDAHQDLAWNMLTFGRDYTLSAQETRRREQGSEVPLHNGDTLLGWPEYQQGRVGIVFATLFAAPIRYKLGDWDVQCYRDDAHAHALYQAQMAAYLRLVGDQPDLFRLIRTGGDLQEVLAYWGREDELPHPVGLVILMEGAECVRSPWELDGWWETGVRFIGPAWVGTRFCGGTREPGGMTPEGYSLLEAMADIGFTLDLSHMDEQAVLQALEYYPGLFVASHSNAQSLLKNVETNRHLSDRALRGLIERDGIVGVVPFNLFLRLGWKTSDRREAVSLMDLIAHVDYICQMAGDARHVGLGSDFDGGFGVQSTPSELETITDLQKIVPLLIKKGYSEVDIIAIMGMNWINMLGRSLPER